MATAQIKFLQGPNTDVPGRAVIGTLTDGAVTCSNGDDTLVASRTWTMLYSPATSAIPEGVMGTTPTVAFTPDVRGGYCVQLEVRDTAGVITRDVRVFQIREDSGRIIPPFKGTSLSMNFGGQGFGWTDYAGDYLRYVDMISPAVQVLAATTAALPAATFSSANNTLTANANGAFPAQDGVSIPLMGRVLIKNQASGFQNGLYQLTVPGSGSEPWVLTRIADADTSLEILRSAIVYVRGGTANGAKLYSLTNPPSADPIVLNTTNLVYEAVGGGASTTPLMQRHDLTGSPVGLWQFNKTLTDDSGNGFTLSVDGTGGARYTPLWPGYNGVELPGSASRKIWRNSTDALLRITGDLCIAFVIRIDPTMLYAGTIENAQHLVAHGLTGDGTAANNYVYAVTVGQGGGGRGIGIFQESGTGTDHNFEPPEFSWGHPQVTIRHVAVTRTANVWQVYSDGEAVGSPSGALTSPADGTSGMLHVISRSDGTNAPAWMASLVIYASSKTATEVKTMRNTVMGKQFGMVA